MNAASKKILIADDDSSAARLSSTAPDDIIWLVADSWVDAWPICSTATFTWRSESAMVSTRRFMPSPMLARNPVQPSVSMRAVRSPPIAASSTRATSRSARVCSVTSTHSTE